MKMIWVLLIRNLRKKDWIWRRRSRMTCRAHCTGNKTENQDARQNEKKNGFSFALDIQS